MKLLRRFIDASYRHHHSQRELSRCAQSMNSLWTRTVTTPANSETVRSFLDASGRDFLQKTHDIMVNDVLSKGNDTSKKVVEFKTPEKLLASMDFSLSTEGVTRERMLELFKDTVENSVHSASPRYFNQLYSGRNIDGLASTWMVETLNANVHTYECGPVFTVAEQCVIKEVCKKLGYQNGGGVFMPGGSMSNFMGVHLARFRHEKAVKEKGLSDGPRQMIFATTDTHYSVTKAAHFLGFGTDSVVYVDSDDIGRMIPADLDNKMKLCKQQGQIPLCTFATSGSTVLGSFDSLDDISSVCQEHDCWLHVDGSWGGAVIFSDTQKKLLKGIEKVDSVSISFHKMIGAQLQCGGVFVRDKDVVWECNSNQASYLFQPDRDYYDASYDIGEMTVQCGRKADGYKLWALWKSRGHSGMQAVVDKAFDNAKYFTDKLRLTDGFDLVIPEFQCVNICFWYVPPSLRGQEKTADWWQKLGKVAPKIKSRMVRKGSLAIGYQPMSSKGYVNFFRIIIDNPAITHQDLDFVLEEIHRLGKDL